ncbi:TPA: phosphatase PAP2 family protein [Clostridioides difficile]|nr:phosphatase PAP2 family protein [Clostridioides difficile]
MNSNKKIFFLTGLLFLTFLMFTFIIKEVDVQPIGPHNSLVGLATLNKYIFDCFGVNLLWYNITDWLGVLAILTAFGFAVVGLYQLIKRKSLFKVDKEIMLLGIFYVIVILVYIFFENVIVNYRPIILETNLEASYPSSHTMIVICIMGTALLVFKHLLCNHLYQKISNVICISLIVITVLGRLISGVHWFTDIIGGILLSLALVMLYYSTVTAIKK